MRKEVKLKHVIIIEVLTVLVLINSFILASFLMALNKEEPRPPKIGIENVQYSIDGLDDIKDGMTWMPYHDYVIKPELNTEMPHSIGNVYAPEILIEDGLWKMWYGGQGDDGKDRIHFATSNDGLNWVKHGDVIGPGSHEHANDPTVVKVNGTYYMYYTVAELPNTLWDRIYLATSNDSLHWTVQGKVLDVGGPGWDEKFVGRPSVLYENNIFKMWYDGTSFLNQRHVGYATSTDGYTWTKWADNPIFNHSGAIDVEHFDGKYVVLEESGGGIFWRVSDNETAFPQTKSYLFTNTGTDFDKYGHVTPFILLRGGKWSATYTGPAYKESWDGNRIDAWFPVYNTSLQVNTGMNLTGIMDMCLTSPTRLEWTFDRSLIGLNAAIQYHNGSTLVNSTATSIEDFDKTYFFSSDQETFILF